MIQPPGADQGPTPAGALPDLIVETERLVVRNFREGDAAQLSRCTADAAEHLRPWLAWAWREPQSVEEKRRLIAGFEAGRVLGECFCGIWLAADDTLIGGAGLHPRPEVLPPGAVEMGYWLHPAHVGAGLATEACAALARVGFAALGFSQIELRIRPDHARSLAVGRRLGFTTIGRLEGVIESGEPGSSPLDAEVLRLNVEEFREGPGGRVRAALRSSPVAGGQERFADLGPGLNG